MAIALATAASWPAKLGRFVLHYFEMCIPMCIGFAVGDAIYFAVARSFGYSDPFSELPVLSVLVVTFSMTAPMTAWMVYRGMPRRAVIEMSAAMPILAAALLVLGGVGALAMENLALIEHGLMMPAMLVPMVMRLDLYAERMHHTHHATA
jgi:hypothetical protein